MALCIFCNQPPENPKVFCKDNPGDGCSYGMHHEFPGNIFGKAKPAPKIIVKKIDKNVCLVCSIHRKHPTSVTNGCDHEYPL